MILDFIFFIFVLVSVILLVLVIEFLEGKIVFLFLRISLVFG